MAPRTIARGAAARGIRMLALTDHNCALNIPPFFSACRDEGIVPVAGIEITSREEVHVLALFAEPGPALELGELLAGSLPAIPNDPERMGDQVWLDEEENIAGEAAVFLGNATALTVEEIGTEIHARGGLFIPAHVDRPMFGMISQLGFIPPGPYDALEYIGPAAPAGSGGYPLIKGSDAHYPEHIGRRSFSFDAPAPGFEALCRALARGAVR